MSARLVDRAQSDERVQSGKTKEADGPGRPRGAGERAPRVEWRIDEPGHWCFGHEWGGRRLGSTTGGVEMVGLARAVGTE